MTQVAVPTSLRKIGTALRDVFVTVFLLVWTTGWLVGTAGLDVMIWRTFYGAAVALSYETVNGRVVRNVAIPKQDSKGNTYHTYRMAYAYEVGGRTYESNRMRLDRDDVPKEWARLHPVGSEVQVLYNPRQPAEAALEIHLTAGHLPADRNPLQRGRAVRVGDRFRVRQLGAVGAVPPDRPGCRDRQLHSRRAVARRESSAAAVDVPLALLPAGRRRRQHPRAGFPRGTRHAAGNPDGDMGDHPLVARPAVDAAVAAAGSAAGLIGSEIFVRERQRAAGEGVEQ